MISTVFGRLLIGFPLGLSIRFLVNESDSSVIGVGSDRVEMESEGCISILEKVKPSHCFLLPLKHCVITAGDR